jgi:DNA-binding MarR family transcriptional regulator
MNSDADNPQESYRSLLLMSEIEDGKPVSQREIAGRLGIALGLVNAYLKTLSQKGFIQLKAYPRNRFGYLLTPKGFAEKSRLALQHFTNYNKIYTITRHDSQSLFSVLRARGVEQLAFCGVDEYSEICYLSLREAQIELSAVIDDDRAGEKFLGHPIVDLATGIQQPGPFFLANLKDSLQLKEKLLSLGIPEDKIITPAHSFAEILR